MPRWRSINNGDTKNLGPKKSKSAALLPKNTDGDEFLQTKINSDWLTAHLIFYYRKMRYNIERQKHMKRTKTLGKSRRQHNYV